MKFEYGQYDGSPFPTPDSLFPQPKVVNFILQYGQQALDAMNEMDGEEQKQFLEQMIAAGLLERDEKTGALRMTPRMVQGIEHRALLEIFQGMKRGTREGHPTFDPGRGDERADGTKPYEFGDKFSEVDLAATMRNAMRRERGPTSLPFEGRGRERGGDDLQHVAPNREQPTDGRPAPSPQPSPPQRGRGGRIRLRLDDFELHQIEGQSDVALCILLDMSGSMMRWGRFFHAKRVALGLAAMMRRQFPQDTLDIVGFYSTACRIQERDLPLVMPKPISTHDYQVRLRVPLEQAEANPQRVPQHFTNLHLGLRMARQILSRRGAANKQMFIITDGQPTAHIEPNPGGGDMLYLIYPPSERTSTITLKEALRCHQQGIGIATFALIEDYWAMDWVNFVDQLTRLIRGSAFYCASDDLSSTVFESYLSGKKKKSFIA